MGRIRQTPSADPATGKSLPDGVVYRGSSQYRARKLVNGRRATQTFTTASQAAKWLAAVETDVARGQFVDITEAQRRTLGQIIEKYWDEILGEDSEYLGHPTRGRESSARFRSPAYSNVFASAKFRRGDLGWGVDGSP